MHSPKLDFDVLIVGAGISGISAAYHIQTKNESLSYAILESRSEIGGTWDLFRYPGVRSDSDMYTLGFPFRPWKGKKSIAQGDEILQYVKDTASEYSIDKHIRYESKVIAANWDSDTSRWTVTISRPSRKKAESLSCRFLVMCSGYYDYDEAYSPDFVGMERFEGEVVRPQFWPKELEVQGKKVVIIGSGATAITLLPELAKEAATVTMLQRSPTYIASLPAVDHFASMAQKVLPNKTASDLVRWKNILLSLGVYQYCKKFPKSASKLLISQASKRLGDKRELIKNFIPRYAPWDQRLCLAPDGDFFEAFKAENVGIQTADIKKFDETGIVLEDGVHLEADIVVLATGLKLKFLAQIDLSINGEKQALKDLVPYKGAMFKDAPNLFMVFGYTNASWTLKCDLICNWTAKLIAYMREQGLTQVTPRQQEELKLKDLFDFSSGYIQRSLKSLPKQGDRFPWKVYQNYFADIWSFHIRPLADKELEFK